MKKIWKNPLLYAICAVIPLSSAMSFNLPNHFAKEAVVKEELPSAISRINKHITSAREEILFHDNTDCLIVYDQFMKDVKRAHVDNKLCEGDLHQIIEAVVFASEYHKGDQSENPRILQSLQRASLAIKTGVYDKDMLITELVKDTVSHSDASLQDIKDSFGAVVVQELTKSSS